MAHKRILEIFHLTEKELPLLYLDLFDWKQPFKQHKPKASSRGGRRLDDDEPAQPPPPLPPRPPVIPLPPLTPPPPPPIPLSSWKDLSPLARYLFLGGFALLAMCIVLLACAWRGRANNAALSRAQQLAVRRPSRRPTAARLSAVNNELATSTSGSSLGGPPSPSTVRVSWAEPLSSSSPVRKSRRHKGSGSPTRRSSPSEADTSGLILSGSPRSHEIEFTEVAL